MQEPGPPIVRRGANGDSSRRSDRLALASVLVGSVLAAVVVAARLAFSGGESRPVTGAPAINGTNQPAQLQAGARQPSPSVAGVAQSPVPSPASTAAAHVANTDGQGVVLRASPRDDDRTPRGFMDGDAVTVVERSGADWAHVRGDNGQDGWVPSKYLGP